MKESKLNIIWIFLNICLMVIGMIFSNSKNLYFILSILGLIQLLVSIIIYKKQGEKIFGPLVIYNIVMYLFLFGQCLMWIITENYNGRNIIKIYSKNEIVSAEIFTLISLFFFHLSCISFKKKEKKNKRNDVLIYKSIKAAGIIILIFSILPEIIYNIRIFTIGYSQGYLGIYKNQATGLLLKFLNLREFFFPSVIMIFVGDSKESKNKILKKLLIIIIILDIFVGFYVGGRSDALMQCLGLLLLISIINHKKITINTYLKIGVLLFVLLSITNAVRNVRTQSEKNLTTFINAFSEKSGNGLLTETMGEMGGTMSTCIETMKLVPNYYNYMYGTSYLYSFAWFLPEQLTGDITKKASMNNWIDSVRYTGSGWGFSTTAEAYFNFGYYGVFAFLIFGYFAGKNFKQLNNELLESNPLELSLSLILFSRLLIFSRIDFLSTLPSIVYFYICIKIFVLLIFYYKKNKRFL